MINVYGIPDYKEVNPALFTIVTFPFLFGVMFGDVGHGLLMFSLAIYLLFYYNNPMSPIHSIRHMIFLMSIFSIFCGLIYNEFFGKPLLVFDSCYNSDFKQKCVYPFGIDWRWTEASNETGFINSFKMKFSIIIGVSHMVLGIFLKILNALYKYNFVDLWFESLPQLIFMLGTFGYMTFCIVIKWLQNWDGRESISIISLFINFFNVDSALYANVRTQEDIQYLIVFVSLACVILMLFPKPIINS